MPSSFAAARPLHRLSWPAARRAAYAARVTLAVGPDRIPYRPSRTGDRVAGDLILPAAARPGYWTRESLWNAVDARAGAVRGRPIAEQPDAQSGLEILLALPRLDELTIGRMADCVAQFCARFTREGLAVQWDIHVPVLRAVRGDTDPLPQAAVHAHLIVSGRPIVGDRVERGRVRIFDPVWRVGWRRSLGWSQEWRTHQERYYAEHALPLTLPVGGGPGERPLGRARFIPAVRAKLLNWRAARRDALRDPEAILQRLTADPWRFERTDLDALLSATFPDPGEHADLRARALRAAIPAPGGRGLLTVASRVARCAHVLAEIAQLAAAPSATASPRRPDFGTDDGEDPDDEDLLREALDPRLTVLDAGDPDAGLDLAITVGAIVQARAEHVVVVAPTVLSYARARRRMGGRVEIRAAQALDATPASRCPRATALIVLEAERLADADLARLVAVTGAVSGRLVLIGRCREVDRFRRVLIDDVLMRYGPAPAAAFAIEALAREAEVTGRVFESLDETQIARDAVDGDRTVVVGDPGRARRLAGAIRAERVARGAVDTSRTIALGGLEVARGDRLYVTTTFAAPSNPAWGLGTHLRIVAVQTVPDRAIAEDEVGRRSVLVPPLAKGALRRAGAVLHHEALIRQPDRMMVILDDPRTCIRMARWCYDHDPRRTIKPIDTVTHVTRAAMRVFERLTHCGADDPGPDFAPVGVPVGADPEVGLPDEHDPYAAEVAADAALPESERPTAEPDADPEPIDAADPPSVLDADDPEGEDDDTSDDTYDS